MAKGPPHASAKPLQHPGSATGRAWQRMLSGRRLDLLDPSPLDVEIEDIAHGLSRVARWNGQTAGDWSFSVAQHSMLVERIAIALHPRLDMQGRRAALLHDASEYVIGDLISPFKRAIGPDYKSVERRIQQAVHIRFGLPGALPADLVDLIKRADRVSARFEAEAVAGFDVKEARRLFPLPRIAPRTLARARRPELLSPLPPDDAKTQFLSRFQMVNR